MDKFPKNATITVKGAPRRGIDVAPLIKTLYSVVAERPEYVYERPVSPYGGRSACAYRDPWTHKPSCLFGHVFIELGIPTQEGASAGVILGHQRYPDWLREAARRAQREQDAGRPWGEAWETFVDKAALDKVYISVTERSEDGVEVVFE